MSWFGRILGKLTNPKSKYVTPGLEEKLKPSAPLTDSDEQKMRRRESENPPARRRGFPSTVTCRMCLPQATYRCAPRAKWLTARSP